ncbi:MAG: hypothetical protein ABEJ03_02590 [Candidatus Nanohaloarchaea archaeon]
MGDLGVTSGSDEEKITATYTSRNGDAKRETEVEGPVIGFRDLEEIAEEELGEGSSGEPRFSGVRVHPGHTDEVSRISMPDMRATRLILYLEHTGEVRADFSGGEFQKVSTGTHSPIIDEYAVLDLSDSEIVNLDIRETEIGTLDLTGAKLNWSNDSSAERAYIDTMKTGGEPGSQTDIVPARWDLRGVRIEKWDGYLPSTSEDRCRIVADKSNYSRTGKGVPNSLDKAVKDPNVDATMEVHEGQDGYGRKTCVEYDLPAGFDIGSYQSPDES